jgi:hypothetical protein
VDCSNGYDRPCDDACSIEGAQRPWLERGASIWRPFTKRSYLSEGGRKADNLTATSEKEVTGEENQCTEEDEETRK